MTPQDRLVCLATAKSMRHNDTQEQEMALAAQILGWVNAQSDTDAAVAVVRFLGNEAASPLKGDGPLRALDNLYRFATNQTAEVGNSASVSAAPTTAAVSEPETPTSRRGRKPKIRD